MRTCNRCGETKLLGEFNRNATSKSGRLRHCKVCKRAAERSGRDRNRGHIRALSKASRDRHPERCHDQRRSWRARNPEKVSAHNAVYKATRSGVLVRPDSCEECGGDPVQAHHDDYGKKLDVRWLCPPCHRRRHRKGGQGDGNATD